MQPPFIKDLLKKPPQIYRDALEVEVNQSDFNNIFFSPYLFIPKKAERQLRRHVSKSILKEIDANINIAIEKCLYVLSNLSSTYFAKDKSDRYKALSSEILHAQTYNSKSNFLYKKIINILIKSEIIEVLKNDSGAETYQSGVKSKKYRLTDAYIKGITRYELKEKIVIERKRNLFFDLLNKAESNPIANHLLSTYGSLSLPSKEQVLQRGLELVNNCYKNKKGKRLIKLGKKSRSKIDTSKFSILEDSIELFDYLTTDGLMIPIVSENAGGRVYDSLNLLPSWIREMILIDNEEPAEVDCVALHPNIALSIYSETEKEHINHTIVADYLNIPLIDAKIEHLSFFNKPYNTMLKSPLFRYYESNHKNMLQNLYYDKQDNGYKSTSKRLFESEVGIMTTAIKELQNKGINVLYCFDALICKRSDKQIVVEALNKALKNYKINTIAK